MYNPMFPFSLHSYDFKAKENINICLGLDSKFHLTKNMVQIGFDASKKIVGVKSDMYCDGGWSPNGVDAFFAQFFGQSCYHIPNLKFGPFGVKTHTQATTATRAPGIK